MKKRTHYLLLIIVIIYSLFIINYFFHLIKEFSLKKSNILGNSTSASINVSLSIGEFRFTLFGYTSPFALVTFSGMGIFDQTTADENGYFVFKNRFSPFSPREACLTAQDQLGRLTSPVCLPPFPINYNVEIGPVIMAPTLTLDKNDYWVGDEVILSGQTIPKTTVNLSMFTNTPNQANKQTKKREYLVLFRFLSRVVSRIINPISSVKAFSFPQLTTVSDEKGNFSIVLPSSSAKTFRFFAQTNFKEKPSPESRKLTVRILPWWMIIIKIFTAIFYFIKSRLLEIIILIQTIGLAIYFLNRYLHPRTLAIIKRERFSLVKVS